jgi:hypothetical protein
MREVLGTTARGSLWMMSFKVGLDISQGLIVGVDIDSPTLLDQILGLIT